MINCLILEDEVAAMEILKSYIAKTPFLKLTGTFESGLDIPPEQLREADLLFLDIQLPEINGISFLKSLEKAPSVIITSAFSSYAVDAFEFATVDYLLKPFPYERFYKAVCRVREQSSAQKDYYLLHADKSIYKVFTDEIKYLTAEVDYVKVVTHDQQILVLDSLQNWEDKLPATKFVRTHRSYIINHEKILKVSGNQVFIDQVTIPIGKKYREQFMRILKSE